MGRAARYICDRCSRAFTLEFFEQTNAEFRGLCLFCEAKQTLWEEIIRAQRGPINLYDQMEALKQENRELKEIVHELKNVVNNLQPPPSPRRNLLPHVETPIRSTTFTTPRVNFPHRPPPPFTPHQNNSTPFRLVHSGKRSATKKTQQTASQSIKTKNRFRVLQDEMTSAEETCQNNEDQHIIIGDSLVRNIGQCMTNTHHKKQTTYVYPGADILRISEKVKEMRQPGKKSCAVVCVGSNDIFKRRVNPEIVVEDYRELFGNLKDRFDNIIMVGTLPRHNVSNTYLSRAIRINCEVQDLCKQANIEFIDNWTEFMNNKRMYSKGGVHLSNTGQLRLASTISSHITTKLNSIFF